MQQLSDVVKNLLIINVLVFFGILMLEANFNVRDYFVLYPRESGLFQPYQLVTYMFNHGGIQHLLFNMMALYFIGPWMEATLGPKRFLFLYLLAGLVAGVAHLFLTPAAAVGASGAINGMMVAFALIHPRTKMMVFPIPFEVPAIVLVGLYILYDLYSGVTSRATGIAHFAHLGGAAVGAFLAFYWGLQTVIRK
jgi:membrane associated rhomboid family serine protease